MRVATKGGSAAGGFSATISTKEMGTMRMNMTPEGQMQMEFSRMTMAQFADTLTGMVDKPVVDMTDLKGAYQAALALSMPDLLNLAAKSGALPAGANPFGGLPGAGVPQASDPSTNSVFTSVKQLGLQLDSRKAPIDFIVVDHAEKTPTEN
jgi:uncharacterized protein (TIGR03435 family)